MRAEVEILVNPDRALEDREDMDFDDDGNLIIVDAQPEADSETPAEESNTEEPAEETATAE